MPFARAFGLLLGFVADRVVGDPRRFHPVAGFGRAATALEPRMYADRRVRGAWFTLALVGSATALGAVGECLTRRRPLARILLVAAATWATLGGRSLAAEAAEVARLLEDGDLPGAREQVTHLVGRDPRDLGPDEIARATVESVAENTSDAVVAPLLAGALCGAPGLLAYRAANTLDAMVGHHSPRYERFGWSSARLDDAANLGPARVAGLLAAVTAPVVGGRTRDALRAWRRDARRHPSPNAGVVEAAFAGALGVTLGGRNVYAGRVEDRARLGTGPGPAVPDV
ncbi:cobalamin biosynthesis protein, partial [Nostocoides japonicum]|uniref:cobalamin biosynthesis protein n=1 Tax=Nostocoides japonicum TaxID=99481 RepID=UPI00065BFF61